MAQMTWKKIFYIEIISVLNMPLSPAALLEFSIDFKFSHIKRLKVAFYELLFKALMLNRVRSGQYEAKMKINSRYLVTLFSIGHFKGGVLNA